MGWIPFCCVFLASIHVVVGQPPPNNLYPPEITNLPHTITIQDTDQGGYYVFNTYCINDPANPAPSMNYFVLDSALPNPPTPPFTFETKNGAVYLNGNPKLDYQMVNKYTLTISCIDPSGNNNNYIDTEVLTINVKPAPYFTNLPNTISIPETKAPQAVFFTVTATDISKLPSGNTCPACKFSLGPSVNTNWFQIDVSSGAISLTQYADYEQQNFYRLEVVATDEFGFTRTGTLTISITDVCIVPVFRDTPYSVNIRQDVTASIVFMTPSVYIEEGDAVDYTILGVSPWSPKNMNLFSIVLQTGALSYINNPGFSVLEQPQYQVTIQMQDKCGTATTVVEVKICDTEAPKLNYGATSATIVEQQSVGTPVPVYWVTTVNSYSAQYMQWTITCCPPFDSYFTVDVTNDHIVVAQPIYYANVVKTTPTGIFTLTIQAMAKICLNLYDTMQITITVTEIQVPPVFNPIQAVVNINEENPVGYPVPWTFTATDGNVGNTITYGFVSSLYSNLFNFINSVGNPHLECAIVFDYDTMPVHQYIFTINAIDNTGLTGTFTLTINIQPVNEPPVFSPDAATVHITENNPLTTSVNYVFTVSDPDIGDSMSMALVPSSFSSYFTLATNPVPYLQTATVFNYEAMNPTTFQIQIKATDQAGLFDTFTMTVIIDNINEAPVFSPSTGTCNMKDMQPIGVSVCMNFFATDPDGDSITYAFQPNQFQSYFTLVTTPIPHLTTATVMNCFTLPTTSFLFTFTASDPGGLYGTFTLTITVTCINQQPFFNPNTGVVVIDEQQAIGTSVPYVFQATDYNSGDTLTYSLQPSAYSTDFTFALLPQPHLETAKKFVYSTMASPSVNVYIRATDAAGLFDTFTLTVIINPVNQPPTFSPKGCNVNIPEGQPIGTSVPCTFLATAGSSSSLIYTVNSNPYSSYFTLYTTPIPHLKTATVFSYSALSVTTFTFVITVTDGNGLTDTFTEVIGITRVQNPPTFTPSSGAVSIPESQAVGSTVPVFFTATNPEGDKMTYALVPSAYSIYFTLNTSPSPHLETATVMTLASLPQSTFNVYVTATNPSGQTATFTMTITVTAVNKPPVFNPTSCMANVNEKQPVGTTAACFFIATDPEGSSITYTIAPSPYSTYFTMVMAPAPHFETTTIFDYYTLAATTFPFTITATDNGGATATYALTINVKPINRAPVFSPKSCSVNFNDNQAVGTTVPCYFSATVSTPGDSVTYSLNAAPYSTYFSLVTTGTPCLKVAQVMTYESVSPTTVFTFTITATNTAGMTDTFTEIISLLQTPKAPVFNPSTCTASLGEGQPIGTTVYCFFLATSVDGTPLTYSVVPSTYSANFNLVLYPQPHLESNYVFVYKTLPSKSLSVSIMATTSVGMTATFTATITILQVVGPPIFVPTSAIVSINEGLPIGSVVPYYFSASDNQGNAMSYTLMTAPYSTYFQLITLPLPHLETTTIIRYNSLLITTFSFTIVATASSSGMTGTFGLTINILQVNVPPVFNVTKGVTGVYEQSPIGTPVPFGFTASDPNIEAVGFSMGSTLGAANVWALKPNPVIHLTVNSVMDYDDPFLVNPDIVVIVATDAHGATTSCSVTISILPIYKNPPTFLAASFSATVPQDAAVGYDAITLAYKQNNGNLKPLTVRFAMYSTAGNGDTYFSINPSTSVISTIKPLTYPMPTMVFNVTMWYPLYPALASSTTVTIDVSYVQGPSVNVTFVPNFYNFEIRADANVNDYIGQVYATLTTYAPNPVIYTMDTDSTYATIDSSTGLLSSVSGMTQYQEYIETVLGTSLSATSSKPVYATFRLDTYSAAECLTDFQISLKPTSVTASMLVSFVSSLQNTLQTQYPDAWPRLVYINRARVSLTGQLVSSQTPLSEPYTNVTVVVLKGTYYDDPAKVNQAKQYYKVPEVLGACLDSNANPGSTMRGLTLSSFSVTTVRPFIYTSVKKTTVTNWWLGTPAGNCTLGILASLGLTLLLLVAAIPAIYAKPMDFCGSRDDPAKPMGRKFSSDGMKMEFEFRYQPKDPARAFQRYDPSAVRNSKPPSRADMKSPAKAMTSVPTPIPWRESNSSMTSPADFDLPDVDDVGYHSRPESKLSANSISFSIRDTNSRRSFVQTPRGYNASSRYNNLR